MDSAVALVQAHLRVNGYFTVTEYPVFEAARSGSIGTTTDLDVLAFRFQGAGRPLVGVARDLGRRRPSEPNGRRLDQGRTRARPRQRRTVGRFEPVEEALRRLHEHRATSLPVVDEAGGCCGTVSIHSFATTEENRTRGRGARQ